MSEIKTIDARGLSCPQPALLTSQVLQTVKKGTIEVLVDTTTAVENISRLAKNMGWKLTVEANPLGVNRMVLQK
jgi:tRNA 2-thiouridine synthesizing protein A